MRVLFGHQIFSLQQYGGISRYFFELIKGFNSIDKLKVEFISPFYINEYLTDLKFTYEGRIKVPVLAGTEKLITWGANTLLIYPTLKLRNNVDIFHDTYYFDLGCSPRSAKRIITVFDMIHERFESLSFCHKMTRSFKKYSVHKADHIICISNSTRNDLIKFLNVPEKKISVVYLGRPSRNLTVNRLPIIDKPYILFVGKRGGYKNFIRLLLAYAQSPLLRSDFQLVCFGGGNFSIHEQGLIKSLGISLSNVLYCSGGDDILFKMYSGASIFIFPSLCEGFGMPLLEAMAYGCPVACSNTSSMPEVVGNAAALFDPMDVSEMRVTIEKIVYSGERSQLLIKHGYNRINKFSWEKCIRDTFDVYSRVLQG